MYGLAGSSARAVPSNCIVCVANGTQWSRQAFMRTKVYTELRAGKRRTRVMASPAWRLQILEHNEPPDDYDPMGAHG